MNTFLTRASTAVIFAAVVICGLLYNKWTFLGLVLAILIGSILEFYRISRPMFKKDISKLSFYKFMVLGMSLFTATISFLVAFGYIRTSFYSQFHFS